MGLQQIKTMKLYLVLGMFGVLVVVLSVLLGLHKNRRLCSLNCSSAYHPDVHDAVRQHWRQRIEEQIQQHDEERKWRGLFDGGAFGGGYPPYSPG